MKRSALPVKKLSSASSRPTTAGLTPAGRLAVEAQVDAIEADIRAEVDARMGEKVDVSAGGAGIEVIGRASGGDFIYDLSRMIWKRSFMLVWHRRIWPRRPSMPVRLWSS